ncbi:NAD(P)-dependent dehydrogenase (short-subunit alcohol dehydrogenase family) [Roseibium marinum]|uniref:NAD(P)-dependent dehydrogenase (Short-subunit alcohol dehydrogenase family) n=1 Tax=Roseibium marinum TaxID=281252 RepID=A0A2S3UNM8_9HYPH|nr:SDR family oxidoreductase [Roseibium marinum]POF29315.1 NAD(P)-dependent dehydrogenase (short-subunit alcohol dehydrogenase family) [Roseibium marinum]
MTDQTSKPVAVVTGAAGDIGAAIAAELAASHSIAAVDIDEAALSATVSRLRAGGAHATAITCDLTKTDDLARMADAAKRLGPVTALINNAGGAEALTLHSMTARTLARDLSLNLEAALNCFKALERALIEGGSGTVVNIASVNGLGTFGHPAYSAAKAGLIHATKAIAVEYGKYGLRANAIAPGTVKTQAWKAREEANPGVFDEALAWYPFKTLPEPEDIAAAAAFLLSPAARCITGVCLPVDSGLSAGSPGLPRTFTQSPDFDGL